MTQATGAAAQRDGGSASRLYGRIVTPGGVIERGYVEIAGDRIAAVAADAGGPPGEDVIVPGFVDMHCHGGGGHTFTTGDADAARGAARFHLGHGTTTIVASLVSSPFPLMMTATTVFAPLVAEGVLAGIHFEGPYLSARRCGAQNPAYLRDADTVELAALIDAGAGAVRMVTLAPERGGALAAIGMLAERGVLAAVGHTDASYEQTRAAIDAGATVGTHVFNGMRPVHHREPGPIVALLEAPGVVCEFIADGTHLHDGTLRLAASITGPDRSALITDAMTAAGMADGDYELGGQTVVVAGGVARLARDGAIAGSTLTLDVALRRTVAAGVPLADAVRMVSTTPARMLGLSGQVGALAPGLRADLAVLDPGLRLVRVMRAGRWVTAA